MSVPGYGNVTEYVRSSGGSVINVEVAPYVVVVHGRTTGSMCTGTLLTMEIVLTLARCFYKGDQLVESLYTVEVWAGVDSLANLSDSSRVQRREVEELDIHPNFRPTPSDPSFGYNDIALLHILEPFNLSASVRAAKLGYQDWGSVDGVSCSVVSYGAVNPLRNSLDDDLLKRSEVKAGRACACGKTLSQHFGARVLRWLCADPHQSGPTPCVGAGGAGLVCGGKLVGLLVGLIPFDRMAECVPLHHAKIFCDNANTVPVFLELCPFMPWLRYMYDDLPRPPLKCAAALVSRSPLSHLFLAAALVNIIRFRDLE